MLEDGDVLLTWRLVELPTIGGAAVVAQRLADHRRAYLSYQGPVSGGRGEVRRVDAGEFTWVSRKAGRLAFDAAGELLRGHFLLSSVGEREWQLILVDRGA